jgi:hypothetical protein
MSLGAAWTPGETSRPSSGSNSASAIPALARRYEERARTACERCGGAVGAAGAGPVVTILCADCSTGA